MLGIDIVEISRIKKLMDENENFLLKVFNEDEIERIKKRKEPYERAGGVFAAKEAVAKALGTGIGKISFHDIKIKYNEDSPYAEVFDMKFDLSISHERSYAVAVAKFDGENFMKKNYEEEIILDEEIKSLWKDRDDFGHKGDFGKIAIIGGSMGMTGSSYLASNAALKAGAGLVYNIVPREIFDIMSIKFIEPIAKTFDDLEEMEKFLEGIDAVAMGPGMGLGAYGKKVFEKIIKIEKNLLIDADGLNILSKNLNLLEERKGFTTILTPHEGEFARLTGRSLEEIKNNRKTVAEEFAKKYKVILVLKGHETIVTDGERTYTNRTGNSGMATGGSGDVLTGIISALMKNYNLFDAARLGVYIHGLSGDIYARKNSKTSLRARDLMENLSAVFKLFEEK
ncbi:holo-[acyl-carrier-protein] synthase [Peptoniphilus harei ACS-146-V-Sch2b]|uniref:Multifunctional fusion protein n=1 Tax=Peptoniphilus harei ACS-146-V-Sch2b TaxID=908338 RepID=E4KZG1_9FIRM|nr:NAD(P)H-hydrate dehydratase [Peptoniphilus harei]EFR32766.1 holo-[acyl-carrier-protein] synthase [Peptoniphilus harei ACS-146-V-Sch2b]MDK7354266.1 NAD(P)H-hydrate dehydratase [Peptoniphilus harei]MDK7370106.1 NAD(P)H-hydrate dehydratase [Peptoniphilus harei]